MKTAVRIIQVIVGVLFILSGLVKANDPMGLSFKMQEFFEIWNADLNSGSFFAKGVLISLFDFLHEHAVFLSVTMITLEVMAGVALLLGWMKKLVLWMLLVLIVFFTFLTAYAFLSTNPGGAPKFTNCGCFGDCLPLQPKTSFLKDLALLVMIVLLLLGQRYLLPVLSKKMRTMILTGSLVLTLLFQWYVLNYLPLADCLPFKKGNNLPAQMKPPPGSVPDSTAIRFIYEKNGKRYEWSPEELPADFNTYKFVDRIDKLVRKGNAEPNIKGFTLTGAERLDTVMGTRSKADSTDIVLSQPLVVIGFGLDGTSGTWVNRFREVVALARQKNASVYFSTNDLAFYQNLFDRNGINIQVFSTDFTIIRTAARTNPEFYILKSGTVVNKYSYKQIDNLVTDLKTQ
jgi:uncharacterized membrane protein YphA (DoxX/SURF4 family)